MEEGGKKMKEKKKKRFTLSISVSEMPWKGAVGGRCMEEGVFGRTTGRGDLWEEGCQKREGAGREFLSTLVHASAAGSPWMTLKNLNNPPLGQKVSCFGFF